MTRIRISSSVVSAQKTANSGLEGLKEHRRLEEKIIKRASRSLKAINYASDVSSMKCLELVIYIRWKDG